MQDFRRRVAYSLADAGQRWRPIGAWVTCSSLVGPAVLLLGDAAHAVTPSMGLGCNAAMEDCGVLDAALGAAGGGGGGAGAQVGSGVCGTTCVRRRRGGAAAQVAAGLCGGRRPARRGVRAAHLLSAHTPGKQRPAQVDVPRALARYNALRLADAHALVTLDRMVRIVCAQYVVRAASCAECSVDHAPMPRRRQHACGSVTGS